MLLKSCRIGIPGFCAYKFAEHKNKKIIGYQKSKGYFWTRIKKDIKIRNNERTC